MPPDPIIDPWTAAGVLRWPDLLPRPLLAEARTAARSAYARAAPYIAAGGGSALPRILPAELAPGGGLALRYVPTADSLSLAVIGALAERLWCAAEATLAPIFAAEFGASDAPQRLVEHAWLRRQHGTPRPPHGPHGWHQDGGLGFDYLGGDPQAADALLMMVTAWIPLVACGRDAPGLRWDPARRAALLALDRLGAAAAEAPIEAPALAAGEAVVMHGGTLHATGPGGPGRRISVELRWLPAGHPGVSRRRSISRG